MEDFADRYGINFVKLIDCRATMKEFEFDKMLLIPTANSYRALIEEAQIEINPRVKNYLSQKWSDGAIENFSFFAMAAAIYARSVSDPPYMIDIGKVLLRTVAVCNQRCAHRTKTGGGCRSAMNETQHHLPKCIKLPRDIEIIWGCVKRYIATGKAISVQEARSIKEPMSVQIDPGPNFAPVTSC
ncbi:MAG: hypothetical protein MUO26_14835 [Methanotrichaceae archaeon]|nr:hypothetical protein [Methanotrichaceae archaeon]